MIPAENMPTIVSFESAPYNPGSTYVKGSTSVSAIVGGILAGVILIAAGCLFFLRHRKQRRSAKSSAAQLIEINLPVLSASQENTLRTPGLVKTPTPSTGV
jgi:cell division protein FtsN